MASFEIRSGFVVIVDDADLEAVKEAGPWHLEKKPNKYSAYVLRHIRVNGRDSTQYLHRFLLNAPKGLQVDHIDGNGLNNSRENLRLCSNAENVWNKGAPKNNTSGEKGVCWFPLYGKWLARVGFKGKRVFVGYFENKDDAIAAVREARKALHGSFARTSWPKSRGVSP
jgi:hypothetical protein